MKKERYFKDELRKMFLVYAIVPTCLITVFCGLVFFGVLVAGRKNSNEEQNRYVSEYLEQVLMTYETVLEEIARQSDLSPEAAHSGYGVRIFERFYQASNEIGCEADMFLLDGDKNIILSNRQKTQPPFDWNRDISWGIFGSMERQPGETAVQLIDGWKQQDGTIAMGKAVTDGDQIEGYLIFTIDSGQFHQVLETADDQTLVTDRFGWVYLTNHSGFVDKSNQIKPEIKGGNPWVFQDSHLYFVTGKGIYGNRFFVYSVSDIRNLVTSLALGSILVLTVLILMTAWIFVSSRKATDKKTKDLYQILDTMELAQQGNLDHIMEVKQENEFLFIAEAYNHMIVSLKRQMENNKKMSELVAVSQNKQLESQFNPHFLYNTLESIRYMVKMDPNAAQKMIYSLSSLLRYSMDGKKEEVTLKEDLDHLNNYLIILKYRYNKRFSYQLDIKPEALDCRIPKLILQPMIENAVKYGFGSHESLGVELKAYLHEEKLILICRDDGTGMTPAVLQEMTELLREEENKSRHSGLYNIHRRICILYGNPYGVEIRSTQGHGTTLVVTLPIQREERLC